jgi:hypothetical protein
VKERALTQCLREFPHASSNPVLLMPVNWGEKVSEWRNAVCELVDYNRR